MRAHLTIYIIAFVACTLVHPIIGNCQDLPEAQRLERCQNNKNRIAQLEAHLGIINKDIYALMSPRELEDTKLQLAFVRTMYDRERKEDWDNYYRLSAQYNFKNDDCYDPDIDATYSSMYKCYNELEKRINEKINKAKSLESKRPQLINKKNEIEKQLAAHRNNLIALRCNETNVEESNGICTLKGKWVHDTEGIGTTTWTITSDGTATEEGKGYAKGIATLDGNILRIKWETTNGYAGTYEWELNAKCSSEKGKLKFTKPITSEHKSTVVKKN